MTTSPKEWRPSQAQCARWARVATSKEALPLIRECWADLFEKEAHRGYFPLFDSVVVDQIIQRVVTNVIEIRTGRMRQGNGASLLITGGKGVGKTTIMMGLCRILGELEPKVICVYHNYEGEKTPLVELLQGHVEVVPGSTFKDVLEQIGASGKGLAMFLDEIQTLYIGRFVRGPDSNTIPEPDFKSFRSIVSDIQRLGKTGAHAFGVVSGSASNTHQCVYLQDAVAKEGKYPNLNNGVYREYVLRPVRSQVELAKAVRLISNGTKNADHDSKSQSQGGSEGDDSTAEREDRGEDDDNDDELEEQGKGENEDDDESIVIAKYFFHTGGVGRFLRAEITEGDSGIRSAEFLNTLMTDVAFFSLITRFSLRTPKVAFSAKNIFAVPSLTHWEVEEIVKPRLQERTFYEAINKWMDDGFLYKTENAHYQLLVPADIEIYRSHVAHEEGMLFLHAALLSSLLGWGGHSSTGHTIKNYIRRRLLDAECFYSWEPVSDWSELPKKDEYLSNNQLAKIKLNKLVGRFFHHKKDCGLDGVFVCNDPRVDGRVLLHALQINTGHLKKKITTGGEAANDQTILGIIEKARHGFAQLFETLAGPPNAKLPTITTFTLFTTKIVDDEVAKTLCKGFSFTYQHNGKVKRVGVAAYLHSAKATLKLLQPEDKLLLGQD